MPRSSLAAAATLAMPLLLVTGCSRLDVTSPEHPATVQTLGLAVRSAEAEPVARGIAAALQAPGLRAWMLGAMQASPWREHKLSLQEIAASRKGQLFLKEAAEGAGMTEPEFLALIGELPPVDLYFPFRQHRLNWRGGAEVAVAATFDGDAPHLKAFLSNGGTDILRLSDGTPTVPLLLLAAAEPRARLSTRAPRSALAVEHPQEVVALTIEDCEEVYSVQDAQMSCEGGGGGSGEYVVPTPGIYITHFHGFDDDGWFGDLEMQFISAVWVGDVPVHRNVDNSDAFMIPEFCLKGHRDLHWRPQTNWNGELLLSPGITATTISTDDCGTGVNPHGYYIEMFERDGDLNAHDRPRWGTRFFGPMPSGSTGLPWGAQIGVNEPYRELNGMAGNSVKANLMTRYR